MTAAPCSDLSRARVVAAARAWIGTPYVHQAAARGAGCDCLGLVRGVWRELYGAVPELPPPYTPSWAEDSGAETMRDAARRHMTEVPLDAARAGDVLLFRMRERGPAKHAAILSRDGAPGWWMVHAYDGHRVVETPVPDPWRRRLAFVFAFPGLVD